MSNAQYAYSWLIDKGLSPEAAGGIVGNLIAESGVRTGAVGDGGDSLGIAQWYQGRKAALISFAEQRGLDVYDLDTQLQFMWHELNGRYSGVLADLRNADSLREATAVFLYDYESPADQSNAVLDDRTSYGQQVYGGDTVSVRASGGGDGGGGGGGGKGGDRMSVYDYGIPKAFLDDHPQVAALIDEAIKGEWSQTKFEAKLQETAWWQKHTEAQRAWTMLQVQDPAQAERDLELMTKAVETMASQLGVRLSDREINELANKGVRNGWTDPEIQMAVGRQFGLGKKGTPTTGQAAITTRDLSVMADEYGLPLSRQRLARWTEQILIGKQTVEGYQDVLREQAKALYPHLADTLDRGATVRQWAEPMLNITGDLLGINPDQINLAKPKWSAMLAPGKDGKPRNLEDWQSQVMSDSRYGFDKTENAQGMASKLVAQLGSLMGGM